MDIRYHWLITHSEAQSKFYDIGASDPTYLDALISPEVADQPACTTSVWEFEGAAEDVNNLGNPDPVNTSGWQNSLSKVSGYRWIRFRILMGGNISTNQAPTYDKITFPFAAQFCEVEVNTRTGEVRLLRFLGAHDSGRVLNRLTYDNQVFGGIVMGVGFAMTEERVLDRQTGKMANANFHDYKIPTMMDVSVEHACLPIDTPDTEFNTTGTKGLGEPATIPTAAAIANAVYDAVGIRIHRLPLTPERVFWELEKEASLKE